MKLFFSFFFLTAVMAETFVVVHHEQRDLAEGAKKVLMDDYFIPQSLIKIVSQNLPCEAWKGKALFYLCINQKQEIEIKEFDQEIFKRSFEVFGQSPEKLTSSTFPDESEI